MKKFILRHEITHDLFDHLELASVLGRYSNVQGKIQRLLASGEIIRIKKGLYTFPAGSRHEPLNPVLAANRIYGPSYVSSDYALARYGLIPERVEEVTSVTVGRPRFFRTPIGNYSYTSRLGGVYPVGVRMFESRAGNYLMATPEKALYDKAADDPRFDGSSMENYLWEDLRIDEEEAARFSPETLAALERYARGRMKKLVRYLMEVADEHRRSAEWVNWC